MASTFKDEAFEDEKEWRIVRIAPLPQEIDCREGKSMLIPYYKLKLAHNENDPIVIDRVVIGPTPHGELSKKSLKYFLDSHKMKWHKIEVSKIPYRDW